MKAISIIKFHVKFSKNTYLRILQGFAFFLCISYRFQVSGQQYTYTQYTKKDGLAGSTVYGMAQDQKGFMWFATETGVSRFDGVYFKNFTTADGLPGNEVLGVTPDSKGRVWITTFSKELCYYQNGKIFTGRNNSLLRSIHTNALIASITESNNGDIIILTKAEYIVLHRDQIAYYNNKKPFSYQKGWFRIFTALYNPGTEDSAFSENAAPVAGWLRANIKRETLITAFLRHAGSNNICILGFNDSLASIYGSKQIIVRKHGTDLGFCTILDSVTFAVKRTNGFLICNAVNGNIEAKYMLPCAVNEIFRDREGEYWFSTRGQGVYKLASPSFKNYKCMEKEINFSIINIQKAGKDIYVAGDNGFFWRYSASSGRPERIDRINARQVFAGSVMMNPYQYIFRLPGIRDTTLNMPVKSAFRISDSLLISSSTGAYLLHFPDMKMMDTIFQGRSTCSFKSGRDYYIGTLSGLYRVDADNKKIYLGSPDKALSSRISFIAASADGIIWIASLSDGVVGIRNDKVVARIPVLSERMCLCLYAGSSFLWAGTEKGIYKIELSSGKYDAAANYNVFDGLPSDIINCIFINEGIVYAGTSSGLAIFNEDVQVSSSSEVYLTGITASGRQADPDEVSEMLLSHDRSDIRFEFSGISFLSGDDIKYKYRLKGLDTLWRWTKDPYLAYSSLPSGKYIFELIAVNRFDQYSSLVSYRFEVVQSVLERWWVRLLIAGFAGLLIFLLVQLRIRHIKRKSEEKININRRMLELEQMALRAQMNPHFIFNCLNSIQSFTIKQDVKGANAYLSRFASLIRQTLENSSKLYIPLSEEIEYLRNYIELERLQMSGGFEYEIITPLKESDGKIPVPNMIIQPYVENAIKHGLINCRYPVPKLIISFRKETEVLVCIIEDNGPGIKSDLQKCSNSMHVSMGMSITGKRIEMLNIINKNTKRPVSAAVYNISDADPLLSGIKAELKFPL